MRISELKKAIKEFFRNSVKESVFDDKGLERAALALPQTEEEPIDEPIGESLSNEAKTYKKGDKLRIKLKNGKKFDVVFDTYTRQKGVALGKFKDSSGEYDIKPFNLDTIIESVNESSKEDIIKDLDKAKNDLLKKVDALIVKKKKLYSNVDIESPMSAEEKKLDKDIADLFSDINKLVLQKRSLKEETINEKKYYVSYNKGRGQGKGLSMEFDKKTFRPLDKPKVFNSYKDAKKYADDMEKVFRNSIGGGTAYWVSDEKMNPIKESELKGYLAADVVDDIVKAIGSKMVKGHVENAPNRNYIYLKLTDIKFGNDVVKMLKSKFGIDAKIDKTFGNIPTVSFPSNKVIKEAQAVSGGKVHKFITGKNLKFKGKSYNQIDFETLGVDNKNGTIRLRIIAPKEIFGNEMSLDFRTVRRGPFFKTNSMNSIESVNEAAEPKIITQLRDVVKSGYKTLKDPKSGKNMKVDSYSASAIIQVYDALSSQNKEKFSNMGLLGMQSMAFKLIK